MIIEDFTNKLFCGDCVDIMKQIPNESIALTITSPPYYNLRNYSHWNNYESYLEDMNKIFIELFRITRPSGWLAWNIQKSIPFPKSITGKERFHKPLTADITHLLENVGFAYENRIIWYKGKGSATQKLFGSYPYPPLILLSGVTEDIILVRKQQGKYKLDRSNKKKSQITKEEWGQWALDFWQIGAEKASKIGHPAPFPIEIPKRLIKLFSFIDDIILDPFLGSGTTAVACKKLNRKFIGIDISEEYLEITKERLKNV